MFPCYKIQEQEVIISYTYLDERALEYNFRFISGRKIDFTNYSKSVYDFIYCFKYLPNFNKSEFIRSLFTYNAIKKEINEFDKL